MPNSDQSKSDCLDGPILNEVQVLLAEKRTALSVLRTGIAVFVLPLSVVSTLIATSKLYDSVEVIHLLVPLLVLCAVLVVLAIFLIIKSLIHLHRYDRIIQDLKRQHSRLAGLID